MDGMNLSLKQLEDIVSNAVAYGMHTMAEFYEPRGKYFTKPELKKYLRLHDIDPSLIDQWVEAGLLKDYQNGVQGTHKYRKVDVSKMMLKYSIVI